MKKVFVFLFFFVSLLSYTITLPKEPEVKTQLDVEENEKYNFPVIIDVYLSSFKIKGNADIKEFKVKVKTEKEGFVFYKDITLKDIKEIWITEWKGTLYDKEKGSYIFYPTKYKIVDYNNIVFEYKQNIKEINKIKVNTTYGKTVLYSIFFDYYNGKKWDSGVEGLSLIRENPIKRVFVKIVFEKESKNE